jgi:uncharacterized protein YndB with AHSA1/START domain
MVDITHRIGIKSASAPVYGALSSLEGLARWWTEEVEGDCRLGGKITFSFRTQAGALQGAMGMEVSALSPHTEVRWRCVEGPDDWIGTELSFQLSERDGQTIVLFGHRNWREPGEHMSHCSMKWATFLLSLREYVETGKGKPAPNDLKIDNWN